MIGPTRNFRSPAKSAARAEASRIRPTRSPSSRETSDGPPRPSNRRRWTTRPPTSSNTRTTNRSARRRCPHARCELPRQSPAVVQGSCIAAGVRCLFALSATLLAGACSTGAATHATIDPAPEARQQRDAALASAIVWVPPTTPVSKLDLATNAASDGRFSPDAPLRCRFRLDEVGGTTPKFYCELADGERVKIKYGLGNPELPAEVAASRLLTALGFPADRMFVVGGVDCEGCPRFPFQALRCYQNTGSLAACFFGGIDERTVQRFDFAVVERRL